MQHDRRVAAAILADIGGAEPLRHLEIELQRAALPIATERVAQHEFELGAVERALARVEREGQAGGLDGLLKILLGQSPISVTAHTLRRPGGKLYRYVIESEISVNREQ